MLKVQLISESQGVLNCDPDPDGLSDLDYELKRSEDHDGVFHEFTVNLKFTKAARNFLRNEYELTGIQGVVTTNLYEYMPNSYEWVIAYTGKIKLSNYTLTEEFVQTNIEQIGFQRAFLNMLKRDVNVLGSTAYNGASLPTQSTINLTLAPKTIKRQAFLKGASSWIQSGFTPGFASVVRLGGEITNTDFPETNTFLSTDVWDTPLDSNDTPPDTSNYNLKVPEAGLYTIPLSSFNFDLFIEVGNVILGNLQPNLTSWNIKIYYQKNDNTPVELFNETYAGGGSYNEGNPPPPGDFDSAETTEGITKTKYYKNNLSLNVADIVDNFIVGDEIYIWFDSDIDFVGPGDSSKNVAYRLRDDFEFKIIGNTIFPATTAKCVLIHEFLERIVQTLTGQVDCFYSEFFGRTDLGYSVDGEGSLLALTNGALIRQVNKRLFANWEQAFNTINAIFCLSWGFETLENGTQRIRVEPKDHFFDKNTEVLTIRNVSNISKTVAKDRYFQSVEVGYPELEDINQVNGIDEFNSLRRFSTPITESKNELRIVSEYRASGFEIESQRRLIGTTKESKLDDKNFLISLIRDGGGYRVKQGSDFTSVTGVFDPDSAYNIDIRPGVMIRNWVKILASNTLRSEDKTLRFTYGEYNYELEVDGVAENDDIEMSDDAALFYCDQLESSGEFKRTDRNLARATPTGVFKFEDWAGNIEKGFLLTIKNTMEKNEADFVLLKVKE